ncbi:MAG: PAS domain S-box protein [bacterium]
MKTNKIKIIFLLLFAVLLTLSVWYVFYVWNKSLLITSEITLNLSLAAESMLPRDALNKLSLNTTDLEKKEYQQLKTSLLNLIKLNTNARFAYLYTQVEDKLFFIADSEPVDSKDYSPPGQEYSEANPQYHKPFTTKQPLITTPATDRWGTWVSVLVPIVDYETKKITAVFAMDYPANKWHNEAFLKTDQAGILVIILFLILYIFYNIEKNANKIKQNAEMFRSFSSSVKEAVAITNAENKVILWNKTAEKMFGYAESEILKRNLNEYIIADENKNGTKNILNITSPDENGELGKIIDLRVKNKLGKKFIVELSVSMVKINNQTHSICVMRDISSRKEVEEKLIKSNEKNSQMLAESEKLNRLMVNREIKMMELKKIISDLKSKN